MQAEDQRLRDADTAPFLPFVHRRFLLGQTLIAVFMLFLVLLLTLLVILFSTYHHRSFFMPRALHILPDFEGCMLGNGDYHIARYIASGGYGKVYSALKVSSSTSVAIKCLRKPVQHSREGEFLMHELSLHQRVSGHPNIVSIHEIIETDSYVFVVLDLCEDGDLHSAIERRAFDRNDEAIRTVFVQLLNAVEHCHDSGVYHRDLKPENIMCSEDHQIRLADFGLSTDKDVCSDGECGSEYYMSPECLESKDGTSYHAVHNDIWALGIILLNILTGLNPWRSASLSDPSYRKYVHSPTSHLRNHYSMLSEDVLRILGQMLCSEPHSRIGIPALRMEIQRLCTFYSAKDLTDGFNDVDTRNVSPLLADDSMLGEGTQKYNAHDSDSGICISHVHTQSPQSDSRYTFSMSVEEFGWVLNRTTGDPEPSDPSNLVDALPLVPMDVDWSDESDWVVF